MEVGRATHEERLRERVAAIHGARRGRLVGRAEAGTHEPAADANALGRRSRPVGGWIDEAQEAMPREIRAPLPSTAALERWSQPEAAEERLSLVATAARGARRDDPRSTPSPSSTRSRTSRPATTTAATSPGTAERRGLADRQPVRIESAAGVVRAELRIDPMLPPRTDRARGRPDPGALHPGASARPGERSRWPCRGRRHLA